MSNWIDYKLEVLGSDSKQKSNNIAERLKQPSPDLANRLAAHCGATVNKVANDVQHEIGFKAIRHLSSGRESVHQVPEFQNFSNSRLRSFVQEHVHEVLKPTAMRFFAYAALRGGNL